MLRDERTLDEQAAAISIRQTLEADLGRTMLTAIGRADAEPARFVVPVGAQEVHVEVSLEPLNARVSASDPTILLLLDELAKAAEKVRSRRTQTVLRQDSESAERTLGDTDDCNR